MVVESAISSLFSSSESMLNVSRVGTDADLSQSSSSSSSSQPAHDEAAAVESMVALTTALDDQSVSVPSGLALEVVEAVSLLVGAASAVRQRQSSSAADSGAAGAGDDGGAPTDAATTGGAAEDDDGEDDVEELVVVASALVDAVLESAETVDEDTAAAATQVISSLVGSLEGFSLEAPADAAADGNGGSGGGGVAAAGGGTNASAAARNLQSAVATLSTRVLETLDVADADDGGGVVSVALRSTHVNLTLEARAAAALTLAPIVCDAAASTVSASLPDGMLAMVDGADTLGPVSIVLTVTSLNLHGLGASAARNASSAGATVTFEMRQAGERLVVSNLSKPLNLSLPLTAAGGALSAADACDCSCNPHNHAGLPAYYCGPGSTDSRCNAGGCPMLSEPYCYDGGNRDDNFGCDFKGDEAGPCCSPEPGNRRSLSAHAAHGRDGSDRCVGAPTTTEVLAEYERLAQTNDMSTAPEVAAMRAGLEALGCAQAIECGWWDAAAHGWSTEGCAAVTADDGAMLCSCTHLTDFMVVEVPTSWDELADHIVMGFTVTTFSWAQATECLAKPQWSFIHLITMVLVGLEVVGLGHAIMRDRAELRFVEAIMAGRRRDRKARKQRITALKQLGARAQAGKARRYGRLVRLAPREAHAQAHGGRLGLPWDRMPLSRSLALSRAHALSPSLSRSGIGTAGTHLRRLALASHRVCATASVAAVRPRLATLVAPAAPLASADAASLGANR